MNGILLVDKPAGITSHDVVARVRRVSGMKRVGHAGTLDPDATGLMVVCLGQATRLAEYLTGQNKRYLSTIQLGLTTTSQDISGATLTNSNCSDVTEEQFRDVVSGFRGDLEQIPPMVSALHHEGKRLYDLARQGITVERAPRQISVDQLDVLAFRPGESAEGDLDICCSKGTYVRTLCFDIGEVLGVGAAMKTLRRTESGHFTVAEAVELDDLVQSTLAERIIRPGDALGDLPKLYVAQANVDELKHGRRCTLDHIDVASISVVDSDNNLIAICSIAGGELVPMKVFNQ